MPLDLLADAARKERIRKPLSHGDARALARRAISALHRISRAYGRRDARIAYYQQKIADLRSSTTKAVDEDRARIGRIMRVLGPYIEENRHEMTNHGRRKTVAFPDGTYKWPPRRFTDIPDESAFFREVRELDLVDLFIRVTEEPNRRAMLETSNAAEVQKLTTARIIEETRPQLTAPGTRLVIEGIRDAESEDLRWEVFEPQER